ncbi:MAG TPA: DUF2782 domain-containing protein [Casimicrobiaceae bacterium]|nr:DUF2782 domain-containing protein [Casimicrobiaceae bacterium]
MNAFPALIQLRGACLAVCVCATAALFACGAFAQSPPPPLPLQAAPLPPPLPAAGDSPAPPKSAASPAAASPPVREEYRGSPDDEPQVTTIRKENETVEEVRIGGELRYVRVTPRHGVPYFLVPSGNGRTFNRMDSLGSGLSVPMWMLFSW